MRFSARDHFVQFLANEGRKLSADAECVLNAAFSMPGAFGAEELVAIFGRTASRVSRSTVYRTLQRLERAGLLRREEANGQAVFVAIATDF